MNEHQKWLSRREICGALGISESSLNRLCKRGVIARPYVVKLGRRVLLSSEILSDLPRLVLKEKSITGEKDVGK
jgi:predicted DNA-binding transcriptional regulator AlpA